MIRFDIGGRRARARVSRACATWPGSDAQNGGFVFVLRPGPGRRSRAAHVHGIRAARAATRRRAASCSASWSPAYPNVSSIDVRDVLARDPRRRRQRHAGRHGRRRRDADRRRADSHRRRGDDEVSAPVRGGHLPDARRQHAPRGADGGGRVRAARAARRSARGGRRVRAVLGARRVPLRHRLAAGAGSARRGRPRHRRSPSASSASSRAPTCSCGSRSPPSAGSERLAAT